MCNLILFFYDIIYVFLDSAYERALKEQGSADVAYARLMLLGSAGTGKTSLKRSLMEEPFNPHTTSTIVSDISSPFLHIWDCGGQPVFLEILPAFLTPRTMFLLLFDASKDIREPWQSRQNTPDGEVLFGEVVNESTSDLIAKWMSTIHSHLIKHNQDDTSPSLYCIGTRGDKLKAKWKRDQVKKQIQSLYEEKEFSDLIKDVLIIDNTTSGKGEGEDSSITKLRGTLGNFIT
uniref:Uncharacterized protein n=2 Tax=Amphimedon queenslandica TaxID=400682 RepID=A0A1X7TQJ4_AMPQE